MVVASVVVVVVVVVVEVVVVVVVVVTGGGVVVDGVGAGVQSSVQWGNRLCACKRQYKTSAPVVKEERRAVTSASGIGSESSHWSLRRSKRWAVEVAAKIVRSVSNMLGFLAESYTE